MVPLLNHLSCQKDKLLSFLAIHFIPLLNIDSPFLIAAQVGEQDLNLFGGRLLRVMYL